MLKRHGTSVKELLDYLASLNYHVEPYRKYENDEEVFQDIYLTPRERL